jgi:hypothetical protein
MSGSIGQLTLAAPTSATAADDLPGRVPAEAMALVDGAAEIAEQLAARNRELHFTSAGAQLRTLDGTVLRTLSPTEALDVMCGLADVD